MLLLHWCTLLRVATTTALPGLSYDRFVHPFCTFQAARRLLTLDEKDPKRLFEGDALLRRLTRYGLLAEDEKTLDDVLGLSTQRLLERRLQTKVFRLNYAKTVHHARVLIRQRHIR